MYNSIHSIDKLIYLANSMVKSVTAINKNINKKINVEDNILIQLKFRNGIIATLNSTFTPYKIDSVWQTQIFGEKGYINLNIRKGLIVNKNTKNMNYDYTNYYKKFGINYNFYLQALSFINSIKKNKKPFINENDGINSILVVDAIYRSLKNNKTIKLN